MGFFLKLLGPETLRKLALWLLRGLEEKLDPELKARVEQYRTDRAAAEAQIETEKKGLEADQASLAQIQQQRSEVRGQISANEAEIQTLKEEARRIDEEPIQTTNPGDDDLLHRDFRSHGDGTSGDG